MSVKVKIVMLIFSLFLFFIISYMLKKDKIPIRYAIVWLFSSFLIFLVSIVPEFLMKISNFLGFEALSSMIIGMILVILLMISMVLTISVSKQKKMITTLIQEVSILKKQKNK